MPSQLTHKLSVMRAQLKVVTVGQVRVHLKHLSYDQQKQLLEADEYWYKLTPVSLNHPLTITAVRLFNNSRMER